MAKQKSLQPVSETSEEATAVATKPMKFDSEVFEQLITDGQDRMESALGEGACWAPVVKMDKALAFALLGRNFRNRWCNDKKLGQYRDQWLTNRRDEHGQPIPGTTEWEQKLYIVVDLDDEHRLHNAQKSIKAWLDAVEILEKNKLDILAGKENVENLCETLGLEPDDLCLYAIVRRGFPESAADYIDMVEQRKNPDVGYRRHIFDNCNFEQFKRKGESDERFEKRMRKVKNNLAKQHNSVLNFLFRRIHDNGCAPRSTPSYGGEFLRGMYTAALKEFPGAVDSVFTVHCLLQDADMKAKRALLNISIPYLMTAHYLAKMSDAKKVDGVWTESKAGEKRATEFIRNILSGAVENKFVAQCREILANKKALARNNAGLNVVYHLLGHMYRALHHDDAPNFQLAVSGSAVYPIYSAKAGQFDPIPTPKVSTMEPKEEEEDKEPAETKAPPAKAPSRKPPTRK